MANKKAYVLYVLKILQEHSDDHNPLTHQQIIDFARVEYGVEMERKAVANSIEILKEEPYNYDIIKGNDKNVRKGFYLGDRGLESTDILYLTTYLLGARNVPATVASRISKELISRLSEKYKKNFREINYIEKVDRAPGKHLPYVIDQIAHALRKNRMISFKYYEYDISGNLVPRKKNGVEHIYTVSPHFLYNSLGKFYLLCTPKHSDGEVSEVSPFRVEFIDNVCELNDKAISINKIKGYERFNIGEYMNTHPYVTGDNTSIEMKLEVLNPQNGIRYLKDWFGNSSKIKQENGKCYATIKTATDSAFWWIMQYSEHFTLLAPKSLIERTRKAAENILKTYK